MILKNSLKILLLMTCVFLYACASPKHAEELQLGKMTFQSGNYKEAFRQLLPLAADGKPEAQYAVGYMYYYGYGVPLDAESGKFWMEKSASQNYAPAIRAMKTIDPSRRFSS